MGVEDYGSKLHPRSGKHVSLQDGVLALQALGFYPERMDEEQLPQIHNVSYLTFVYEDEDCFIEGLIYSDDKQSLSYISMRIAVCQNVKAIGSFLHLIKHLQYNLDLLVLDEYTSKTYTKDDLQDFEISVATTYKFLKTQWQRIVQSSEDIKTPVRMAWNHFLNKDTLNNVNRI